jgi:hypothetical protein
VTLAAKHQRTYFLVGHLDGRRIVPGPGYAGRHVSADVAEFMRYLSIPRSYDEVSAWAAQRDKMLLGFVTNDAIHALQPAGYNHRLSRLRGIRIVSAASADSAPTPVGPAEYKKNEDVPRLARRLHLDAEALLKHFDEQLQAGAARIEKVPRNRLREFLDELVDAHMGS